jgi:hypothetical protein
MESTSFTHRHYVFGLGTLGTGPGAFMVQRPWWLLVCDYYSAIRGPVYPLLSI